MKKGIIILALIATLLGCMPFGCAPSDNSGGNGDPSVVTEDNELPIAPID